MWFLLISGHLSSVMSELPCETVLNSRPPMTARLLLTCRILPVSDFRCSITCCAYIPFRLRNFFSSNCILFFEGRGHVHEIGLGERYVFTYAIIASIVDGHVPWKLAAGALIRRRNLRLGPSAVRWSIPCKQPTASRMP